MNHKKNLIGFFCLISIVTGCSSVSSVEKSPTAFTRNFTASYIDTWNTVNKVLDKESLKVIDKNKEKGIILLKPIKGVINPWDLEVYVKSVPPDFQTIDLDSVKVIVRGSENISAVQIIPKFHCSRSIRGVSTTRESPILRSMKETLESNGVLEMDLFEKISDTLK